MNQIIWHKHHILPEHMGGTNDPSNLLKVNIPLHRFLHKLLWEKHGHWQDKVAWQTLSGQITVADAMKIAQSEGGKLNRGKLVGELNPFYGKKHTKETKEKISQKKKGQIPPNKGIVGEKNKLSKIWLITSPDGKEFAIKGLQQFCKENGLYYQCMGQVSLGKLKQHKGYKCKQLLEGVNI